MSAGDDRAQLVVIPDENQLAATYQLGNGDHSFTFRGHGRLICDNAHAGSIRAFVCHDIGAHNDTEGAQKPPALRVDLVLLLLVLSVLVIFVVLLILTFLFFVLVVVVFFRMVIYVLIFV